MAKDRKTKHIPKRVGGIKVPKELRRAGDALIDKANSPQGREMLVGALAMAATAATAAAAKRAKPPAAAPAADDAAKPAAPDPQALANALGGMAEAAIGRFFGGLAKG